MPAARWPTSHAGPPVGGLAAARGRPQRGSAWRSAGRSGASLCGLSTMSVCSLEEVAGPGPRPVPALCAEGPRLHARMLARAKEAGCPVLAFTVDLPIPGARYRDVRSGLHGVERPFRGAQHRLGTGSPIRPGCGTLGERPAAYPGLGAGAVSDSRRVTDFCRGSRGISIDR